MKEMTAQIVVHIVALIGGWTIGSFLFGLYRDRTLRTLAAKSRLLGAETRALHEEIRTKTEAHHREIDARARERLGRLMGLLVEIQEQVDNRLRPREDTDIVIERAADEIEELVGRGRGYVSALLGDDGRSDATARGLALLAELPPDEREMLLTGDALPADESAALLHEMMREDDR